MSECTECIYFITYPKGEIQCLMREELCIISGKTSYPKDCKYFKKRRGIKND